MFRSFGVILYAVGTVCSLFGAEPARRLYSNPDGGQTFALQGNIRPVIAKPGVRDEGEVAASQRMPRLSLHFSLTAAQQADLEQFLKAVQDRRSRQYHKFLTPEQFGDRFGLNLAELARIAEWLEANGFSHVEIARGRTSIGFNGTAGQVENTFHTAIHKYVVNGETHFANATNPELPKALEGFALSLSGLHNFHLKPSIRATPRFTSPSGSNFLAPDDWATIYDVKALYGAGWDGSPLNSGSTTCGGSACSIAVVGQSDVQASDLAAFRSAAHLPAKAVTVLIPPFAIDPGFQSGDEGESDLDLEWSNAIAPNASVVFVTTDFTVDSGVVDSIFYGIDNDIAPIMTISYGVCEADWPSSDLAAQTLLYQQANAQGMTVVAASGDLGAADCDNYIPATGGPDYPATLGLAVNFPASSANVTGVGGTTLEEAGPPYWSTTNNVSNGSALSYIPEDAWNDSVNYGALSASGGGASSLFAKPGWQAGPGVPADGARDVPDIALAASPYSIPYLVCGHSFCVNGFVSANSSIELAGGTSAGAPTFAGVLALLLQKQGTPLGNINPNLYVLAQAAPDAFHDITFGSNVVACVIGTPDCNDAGSLGYSAGVGYDQATGLGSIDAFNLVEEWSADIQMTASPIAVTVSAGASATASVTVAPLQGFSGDISFGCTVGSGLANVSCSVPSSTVNTSGTTMVTISAGSTAGVGRWRRQIWPPLGLGAVIMLWAMIFTKRRQRTLYAWGAIGVAALTLAVVSCGGGSGSGASGPVGVYETGNIIVTATSGQIRNQVLIAVTVPAT